MTERHRTRVAIIGAGPAGLVLSHFLMRDRIDAVVLENRSREYVEQRVRAGVLEHGTVELLDEIGMAARLRREGIVHHGIELRFDREGHRVPLTDLTGGRSITIYGQQEVVKDLIQGRLAAGGEIRFAAEDVSLHDLMSETPVVRYTHDGRKHELRCDIVAGCDGFHGVSRAAIPAGILTTYQRDYPYAWLGVLAAVAPSTEEVVYALHDRGFALHSLRSPEISRLYLQVHPGESLDEWPDARVWDELHRRLARDDGWRLREGPILERTIAPMRSFVVDPMRYGRLFLAGDAAHIVPPTGAKGLNLAVADVRVLAAALVPWHRTGAEDLLDAYSATCLRRVWRAEHFSWWMTTMLHRQDDPFQHHIQRAQLREVTTSHAAATWLAENYVG